MPTRKREDSGEDEAVRELRAAITKLTGRATVSSDQRYLARRLADLRARKRDGEDVRPRPLVCAVASTSIALGSDARVALVALANRERVGVSALVKRAVADLADRLGHTKEAAAIRGDIR